MPEPQHPLKVFLCHASADKPKVRKFYRYLKKHGIQPWFDEIDLIGGQDWQIEIPKALSTSDAIIICLTKNSADKEGYIQNEIKFALDKALGMPEGRIFLIPVKFEECEVPFSLRRYQWVDLTIEAGYSKMMQSLKFRASQLERTNVDVSKIGEEGPAFEIVEQEKVDKEKAVNLRQKKRPQVPVVKDVLEHKTGKHKASKTKISSPIAYWVAGIIFFVILAFGVLFSKNSSLLSFMLMPTNTQFSGSSTSIFTETSEPSVTPTKKLTLTPISTLTLTPLPSEITDDKGSSMMFVPAGEFKMGANNGRDNEQPVHQVFLEAFYIDKYEVTNMQYKACVNAGGCEPLSNELYYNQARYADHPVTFVNWYTAKTYCSWREARLPTEAEWEKAARGSNELAYPWGDTIDCSYANYRGANGHCVGDSTSVGSYEGGKSVYGVYDMAGNAMELVSSVYADYPYNANDGREGLNVSSLRVIRGGSWNSKEFEVRSTDRAWVSPSSAEFDFGFRCAKDAP